MNITGSGGDGVCVRVFCNEHSAKSLFLQLCKQTNLTPAAPQMIFQTVLVHYYIRHLKDNTRTDQSTEMHFGVAAVE